MKLYLIFLAAVLTLPVYAEITQQDADKEFNAAVAEAGKIALAQTDKAEADVLAAIKKHPFKETELNRIKSLANMLRNTAKQPLRALPYYKQVYEKTSNPEEKLIMAGCITSICGLNKDYPAMLDYAKKLFAITVPDPKKAEHFRLSTSAVMNRDVLHPLFLSMNVYKPCPKEILELLALYDAWCKTPGEKLMVGQQKARFLTASGETRAGKEAWAALRSIPGLSPMQSVTAWLGPWEEWRDLRNANEAKLNALMKEALAHFKDDKNATAYLYERWLFRANYDWSPFAPEQILAIAEEALQHDLGNYTGSAVTCKFTALVRMNKYQEALAFVQPYLDKITNPAENAKRRIEYINIMTKSTRWNMPARPEALRAALTLCKVENAPDSLKVKQIRLLLDLDEIEEAEKMIPIDSTASALLVPIASYYLENGQADKALKILRRVDPAEKGLNAAYFKLMSHCLYAADDVQGAIDNMKAYQKKAFLNYHEGRAVASQLKFLESRLPKK